MSFKCTIGDRAIEGIVKKREDAKKEFEEAKQAGLVAGLMEQSYQASDIFKTTLGNVPGEATLQVDIQFIGELRQDFQTEGIRFTLPAELFPRYGSPSASFPLPSSFSSKAGFTATVDIQLPEGVAIKAVQSPSHPIDVSIGTTSANADAAPSISVASATIAQAKAEVDTDFVVIVTPSKIGEPAALLETHTTLPNQRALMTSLIPKFVLPAETPEIVFVCDRSGSMSSNMEDLKRALSIFIKSLPAGVSFNICSFGSHFDFLWPSSRLYDQRSVDEAVKLIGKFKADYGGTEMYEPIQATFKKRHAGLDLEVFVLTDGGIWGQERLFELINGESRKAGGNMRLFSLGIGSGASTSLVEGIARAGNGFAQFVADNEKMDRKVVRMLKASLYPHINNFKLELEYGGDEDSEDFEVVDAQSTIVDADTPPNAKPADARPVFKTDESSTGDVEKVISLFDENARFYDAPPPAVAPLPNFGPQPFVQTPSTIPPLFPLHRSTVYVFLNETAPQKSIKSVVLSADSKHGKLKLDIPVTDVGRGATIHQLAARKESHELEEGRGFIASAQDEKGLSGRDRVPAQWDAIVEREGVFYGQRYQVANRWCSFVAVERLPEGKEIVRDAGEQRAVDQDADLSARPSPNRRGGGGGPMPAMLMRSGAPPLPAPSGVRLGAPPAAPTASPRMRSASAFNTASASLRSSLGSVGSLFGSAPSAPAPVAESAAAYADAAPASESLSSGNSGHRSSGSALERLTALQRFDGSWVWSAALEAILDLKLKAAQAVIPAVDKTVLATALAVAYFRTKLAEEADVWELMVEKAEAWLATKVQDVSAVIGQAKSALKV